LAFGWKRLLVVVGLAAAPLHGALAAGNADIVDDAAVLAPGTCSVEAWNSNYLAGVATFAQPSCTFLALPTVEFGAVVVHGWHSIDDIAYGPKMKINLRDEEAGTSVALSPQGVWNAHTGTFDAAAMLGLLTVPATQQVNLNLNLGWTYGRLSVQQHAAFGGAQFEAQVTDEIKLMVEGFGRFPGDVTGQVGGQVGIRWNPNVKNVDYDLKVGTNVLDSTPCTISLGVSVRW
jgi:hypothetical protein